MVRRRNATFNPQHWQASMRTADTFHAWAFPFTRCFYLAVRSCGIARCSRILPSRLLTMYASSVLGRVEMSRGWRRPKPATLPPSKASATNRSVMANSAAATHTPVRVLPRPTRPSSYAHKCVRAHGASCAPAQSRAHASSHLRTPSYTFAQLRTPSHTFAHLRTPSQVCLPVLWTGQIELGTMVSEQSLAAQDAFPPDARHWRLHRLPTRELDVRPAPHPPRLRDMPRARRSLLVVSELPADPPICPPYFCGARPRYDSNPCAINCMPNPVYDILPRGAWLVNSGICQRQEDFLWDPISQVCTPCRARTETQSARQ